MAGCWAVLTAFHQPLGAAFDGGYITDSPLSWAARDSSKPGRDAEPETWTLHASPEWSEENLELEPVQVVQTLLSGFFAAAGIDEAAPRESWAHRWRFALPPEPLEDRFLFDEKLGIGACGDWCAGPRVEGAWLSGRAIAKKIIE